ncbi:MAG: hypothetical protein KC503_12635 [Myxococcales bacterium]|nr:hypothetical protein [Myxococcales bacterium]
MQDHLRECVAGAYKHFSPATSRRVLAQVVDPSDIAVRDRLRSLKLRDWQSPHALEYLGYATLGEDTKGLQRVLPRLLELLVTERLAFACSYGTLLGALLDALRHDNVQRWPREDLLIVERFFEHYLVAVMHQEPSHAVQLALDLTPVVGNVEWCLQQLLSERFDASTLLQFLAACSQADLGHAERPTNAPRQVLRRWLGADATYSYFETLCLKHPELADAPSYPEASMCFVKFRG